MTFLTLKENESVEQDRDGSAAGELAYRVAGHVVPTVTIDLEPGQGIVCHLPRVIQAGNQISIRPWPGLEGRMHLVVNRDDDNNSFVTLSAGRYGCAGLFELASHGGRLLCPQKAVMATGPGVMVSVYAKAREDHEGDLDVLLVEGKGMAFLRGCGEVTDVKLNAGEQTIVNLSALAAMRATIDIDPLNRSGAPWP